MALLNNSFHFIAPEIRQLTAMTAEWAYFFQFSARCLPATTVRNGSFPPWLVPHTFALFVKRVRLDGPFLTRFSPGEKCQRTT
jgi:hypothetical protein